jgi:hypothetical protein
MRLLLLTLNYLDSTLAYEKVSTFRLGTEGSTRSAITHRVFVTILEYGLAYLIFKFIQLVISLLVKESITDVSLLWFVFPVLYSIEIGSTKMRIYQDFNFLRFIIRATAKLLVILAIDKGVGSLYERIG